MSIDLRVGRAAGPRRDDRERSTWRKLDEAGQAWMAIALALSLVMITIPVAIVTLERGQTAVTSQGSLQKQAVRAAQAGIADYQSRLLLASGSSTTGGYGSSYCSNATFTACTKGLPPSGTNPAYVNTLSPRCNPPTGSWALTSGTSTGIQTGYQYVVNSSEVSTAPYDIYVYVTGHAGRVWRQGGRLQSNFSCVTMKAVFTDDEDQSVESKTVSSCGSGLNIATAGTNTPNEVTVTVDGASGATGTVSNPFSGPSTGASGGGGQAITAAFPSSPGTTFAVVVGCSGQGGTGGQGYTPGGSSQYGGAGGASSALCYEGTLTGQSIVCAPNEPSETTCKADGTYWPGTSTPCVDPIPPNVPTKLCAQTPSAPCVLAVAAGGGGGGEVYGWFGSGGGGGAGGGGPVGCATGIETQDTTSGAPYYLWGCNGTQGEGWFQAGSNGGDGGGDTNGNSAGQSTAPGSGGDGGSGGTYGVSGGNGDGAVDGPPPNDPSGIGGSGAGGPGHRFFFFFGPTATGGGGGGGGWAGGGGGGAGGRFGGNGGGGGGGGESVVSAAVLNNQFQVCSNVAANTNCSSGSGQANLSWGSDDLGTASLSDLECGAPTTATIPTPPGSSTQPTGAQVILTGGSGGGGWGGDGGFGERLNLTLNLSDLPSLASNSGNTLQIDTGCAGGTNIGESGSGTATGGSGFASGGAGVSFFGFGITGGGGGATALCITNGVSCTSDYVTTPCTSTSTVPCVVAVAGGGGGGGGGNGDNAPGTGSGYGGDGGAFGGGAAGGKDLVASNAGVTETYRGTTTEYGDGMGVVNFFTSTSTFTAATQVYPSFGDSCGTDQLLAVPTGTTAMDLQLSGGNGAYQGSNVGGYGASLGDLGGSSDALSVPVTGPAADSTEPAFSQQVDGTTTWEPYVTVVLGCDGRLNYQEGIGAGNGGVNAPQGSGSDATGVGGGASSVCLGEYCVGNPQTNEVPAINEDTDGTTVTTTCNVTNNSSSASSCGSLTSVVAGDVVSDADNAVPSGTTVSAVSGSSVTLSANATATESSDTMTFTSVFGAASPSADPSGESTVPPPCPSGEKQVGEGSGSSSSPYAGCVVAVAGGGGGAGPGTAGGAAGTSFTTGTTGYLANGNPAAGTGSGAGGNTGPLTCSTGQADNGTAGCTDGTYGQGGGGFVASTAATTAVVYCLTTLNSPTVKDCASVSAVGKSDTVAGSGIPSGTTVSSAPSGGTIPLSATPTVSSSSDALTFTASVSCKVTSGSATLQTCGTSPTTENGQIVTGTGIPAGTYVVSGGGTATITLSNSATATNSSETVTFTANLECAVSTASADVTNCQTLSSVGTGNPVSGSGIPSGTTVASASPSGTPPSATLSQNATAMSSTATALTFSTSATTCTVTDDSTSVTGCADANAPALGDGVTDADGDIPSGDYVSASSGGTLTLSEPASGTATESLTFTTDWQVGGGGAGYSSSNGGGGGGASYVSPLSSITSMKTGYSGGGSVNVTFVNNVTTASNDSFGCAGLQSIKVPESGSVTASISGGSGADGGSNANQGGLGASILASFPALAGDYVGFVFGCPGVGTGAEPLYGYGFTDKSAPNDESGGIGGGEGGNAGGAGAICLLTKSTDDIAHCSAAASNRQSQACTGTSPSTMNAPCVVAVAGGGGGGGEKTFFFGSGVGGEGGAGGGSYYQMSGQYGDNASTNTGFACDNNKVVAPVTCSSLIGTGDGLNLEGENGSNDAGHSWFSNEQYGYGGGNSTSATTHGCPEGQPTNHRGWPPWTTTETGYPSDYSAGCNGQTSLFGGDGGGGAGGFFVPGACTTTNVLTFTGYASTSCSGTTYYGGGGGGGGGGGFWNGFGGGGGGGASFVSAAVTSILFQNAETSQYQQAVGPSASFTDFASNVQLVLQEAVGFDNTSV